MPSGITWKTARLVSGTGAIVQQHRATLPASSLHLDLGTLPTGLYLLDLETGEGQVRRKVVKE